MICKILKIIITEVCAILQCSYYFCVLATVASINEDTTKESNVGNPIPIVVTGTRGNGENTDTSKGYSNAPPPATSASISAPVSQSVPLLGKFTVHLMDMYQHTCISFKNIHST